jgi:hypothetical protein
MDLSSDDLNMLDLTITYDYAVMSPDKNKVVTTGDVDR